MLATDAYLGLPYWVRVLLLLLARLMACLEDVEARFVHWATCHAVDALRVALGGIYLYLGSLKYFAGSAAEELAGKMISLLTAGLAGPQVSIPVLATAEAAVGLALVANVSARLVVPVLMGHMAGTFSPLVLLPHETFGASWPYAPTLVGQYILTNVLIVGTALVLSGTAAGGRWVVASRVRESV
jgi:hypothetical protein